MRRGVVQEIPDVQQIRDPWFGLPAGGLITFAGPDPVLQVIHLVKVEIFKQVAGQVQFQADRLGAVLDIDNIDCFPIHDSIDSSLYVGGMRKQSLYVTP